MESNGCQVCQANTRSDNLMTAQQPYFDLVVLNLEGSARDNLELCQKLVADSELDQIPVVMLTSPGCPLETIAGLKTDNIYCLARTYPGAGTICAEMMLIHLIQRIRYMIDRYI